MLNMMIRKLLLKIEKKGTLLENVNINNPLPSELSCYSKSNKDIKKNESCIDYVLEKQEEEISNIADLDGGLDYKLI
jgi:hypothetical protein